MSSTNKTIHGCRYPILGIILTLTSCYALGQEPEAADYEQQLDHIKQIEVLLHALDQQAEACLETMPRAVLDNSSCQAFLNAIDGEPVARYLRLCQALRDWREDFVSDYQTSGQSSQHQTSQALQLLVQTEYYCAENALRLRTEHVLGAFTALNQSEREVERDSDYFLPANGSRNGDARTGARDMHERLRRETDRQWRDLELEMLRRQLNRK